jgi:hypothetical protein
MRRIYRPTKPLVTKGFSVKGKRYYENKPVSFDIVQGSTGEIADQFLRKYNKLFYNLSKK